MPAARIDEFDYLTALGRLATKAEDHMSHLEKVYFCFESVPRILVLPPSVSPYDALVWLQSRHVHGYSYTPASVHCMAQILRLYKSVKRRPREIEAVQQEKERRG
jgi:hypothetical protein